MKAIFTEAHAEGVAPTVIASREELDLIIEIVGYIDECYIGSDFGTATGFELEEVSALLALLEEKAAKAHLGENVTLELSDWDYFLLKDALFWGGNQIEEFEDRMETIDDMYDALPRL